MAKAIDGDWSGVGKSIDAAGDAVLGKNGIFRSRLWQSSNNTADWVQGGGVAYMRPPTIQAVRDGGR